MAADGSSGDDARTEARHDLKRISSGGLNFCCACTGVVGVLLLLLQITSAVAQVSERQRGYWPERRVEWPSRQDISDRRAGQQEEAGSVDRQRLAAGILADASKALEQGEVMLARRRLEVLIETYPETPAANLARERLLAMFGSNREGRSAEAEPRGSRRAYRPPQSDDTDDRARSGQGLPDLSPRAAAPGQDDAHNRQRRQLQEERKVQMLGHEFQAVAGDRVFFAETSSDLGGRARAVIASQARWLGRHSELPIVIEAHADDHRTNRERDTELSQKRAEAVAAFLVEQGVARDRIVIYAFGRDRPIATCHAPECAAQNRRVVVRIGGRQDGNDTRRSLEEPALATVPGRALRSKGN